MSKSKRNLWRSVFKGNGGCGNCSTPKPFEVYDPTPKPKISRSHPNPNPTILTTSPSMNIIPHERGQKIRSENSVSGGKLSGSIVVEMKSENPYDDFKESMIQMMMEREIYSTSDLQELLQWFLNLNSPCFHQLILRAFSDICHHPSPSSSS